MTPQHVDEDSEDEDNEDEVIQVIPNLLCLANLKTLFLYISMLIDSLALTYRQYHTHVQDKTRSAA